MNSKKQRLVVIGNGMEQRQRQMENIRQRTEGKANGDAPGAQKRWWWPFGE